MTKEELAARAGTSRPTLSAYEHGRKSPRLDTALRIIDEAGFSVVLEPTLTYREIITRHHRVAVVPTRLLRLSPGRALARFVAPLHLDWSAPNRQVDLADRQQRARWYETVLREGTAADIAAYVDGVLLVDLWTDLVVPQESRDAWQLAIDAELGR